MIRRLGLLGSLLALVLMITGCIVRTPGHGHHHRGSTYRPARRSCPPGHNWDGARCRNRGRGHRHRY